MSLFKKKTVLDELPVELPKAKTAHFETFYQDTKNNDSWNQEMTEIKTKLNQDALRQELVNFSEELTLIESEIKHSLKRLKRRAKS